MRLLLVVQFDLIWQTPGMYEVSATYDGSTAKSGFFFLGQLDAELTGSTADVTVHSKKSKIISQGAGVLVNDFKVDEEFTSLILGIDSIEPPYVVEVMIPRMVLDSRHDNQDEITKN